MISFICSSFMVDCEFPSAPSPAPVSSASSACLRWLGPLVTNCRLYAPVTSLCVLFEGAAPPSLRLLPCQRLLSCVSYNVVFLFDVIESRIYCCVICIDIESSRLLLCGAIRCMSSWVERAIGCGTGIEEDEVGCC